MNVDSHTTRISKQRWGKLLLPIAAISGILALAFGLAAEFWRGFQVPALTLGLWAYLRYTTPTAGMVAVSINGNCKVKLLLKWLAFIVLITVTWVIVDTLILGNSIYSPLSRLEMVGFAALVVALLAGVFVIERRYADTPRGGQDGGKPRDTPKSSKTVFDNGDSSARTR